MSKPEPRGFGPVGVPYYGAEGEDYDYYESGDYDRDRQEVRAEEHYALMEMDREREEEEMRRSWTTELDQLPIDVPGNDMIEEEEWLRAKR